MRKVTYILLFIFSLACNSDKANDCFQSAGKSIQQDITIGSFSQILVNRDIELIITEGPAHKIIIETGENLINDIEVFVVSNRLELTNNNTCNFVRDYGLTKIYVTAPNIKKIIGSTQYPIRSAGILNYENLELISEDFTDPKSSPLGDFSLQLNATNLKVVSNNISSFFISGNVENLNISFPGGNGRFEGANLIAEKVDILHRGSNDMIVNPQQELKGRLISVGNLISKNAPPIVDVETAYLGELIFE